MKQQTYKNHYRYIPLFHFVTYAAVIAIFIGSIVYLFKSPRGNALLASLLVVIAFVLGSLTWYSRAFALRAQDRAIRAEENFRHFILTGSHLINACVCARSLRCVLLRMKNCLAWRKKLQMKI